MADKKYEISVAKFEDVFKGLHEAIKEEKERIEEDHVNDDYDLDELMVGEVQVVRDGIVESEYLKKLKKVYGRLEGYCKELPVFGFNSSGYDLKFLKQYLMKELCTRGEEQSFTVKKAGKYPCVKTESLKFLDILNYLVPGCSLQSFVKAFDTNKAKGYFCYNFMDSAAILNGENLPSYNSFFSSIKGCNVLEAECNAYQKLLAQDKSQQQALQLLHLQEVPKTRPENYAWLQQLWNENEWTTFADYL